MFCDLKWDDIERASTEIQQSYNPSDYLVLFIKPTNGKMARRNITVEHFKVSLWHLYNSEKSIDEIAVVAPKLTDDGENTTVFRHSSKNVRPVIDEGMPTSGDSGLITNWKKFNEKRKDALVDILISQFLEESNDGKTG